MNTTNPQPEMIVTRFAPSPTGFLHLGNYRTALFSYLHARRQNGKFILRIEDTDKERSKKEYDADIIESLAWLNLPYDEMYRQSDREEIYRRYLRRLIEEDKAYVSKETPIEEGGRTEVIRFRNPNKPVSFNDVIRGTITVDTTELGDFVIAKSLEEPLFHLAVVVDDFEMGVTHVERGEDHIPNTPRHILLQEAIGAPHPVYAHLPIVLATDRSKLSKRKGALSIKEYRELGYLPEAVINTLALIGWNPGTDQEFFSLEDLVKVFDPSKIQKASAIFNVEKLNWFNKEYLKKVPDDEFAKSVLEFLPEEIKTLPDFTDARLAAILPMLKERITIYGDLRTMAADGELQYFFEEPTYASVENFRGSAESIAKGKAPSLAEVKENLQGVIEKLSELSAVESTANSSEGTDAAAFSAENVKAALWDFATEKGRGAVLWPMRYALSGKEKSADPFTLAAIFGKDETIRRIEQAIKIL